MKTPYQASTEYKDRNLMDLATSKLTVAAAEGLEADTVIGTEAQRVAARMRQLSNQGLLGRLFNRCIAKSQLHTHVASATLELRGVCPDYIEDYSGFSMVDSFSLFIPQQLDRKRDTLTIRRKQEGEDNHSVPTELSTWSVVTRTNTHGDLRRIEVLDELKDISYTPDERERMALGVLLGVKATLGIK